MDYIYCQNCRTVYSEEYKDCPKCGWNVNLRNSTMENQKESEKKEAVYYCLLAVDAYKQQSFEYIVDEKVLVGRSDKCNIVIDDERVSREHALLEIEDGKVYLTDLNASNHTYINGQILTPNMKIRVNDQDAVAFHKSAFKVKIKKESN